MTTDMSDLTDGDLIRELIKRKRLIVVTAESRVPKEFVERGYPLERQVRSAYQRLAEEMNRCHYTSEPLASFLVQEDDSDPYSKQRSVSVEAWFIRPKS